MRITITIIQVKLHIHLVCIYSILRVYKENKKTRAVPPYLIVEQRVLGESFEHLRDLRKTREENKDRSVFKVEGDVLQQAGDGLVVDDVLVHDLVFRYEYTVVVSDFGRQKKHQLALTRSSILYQCTMCFTSFLDHGNTGVHICCLFHLDIHTSCDCF